MSQIRKNQRKIQTQHQKGQMLTKGLNIIGGIAAIFGIAAFAYYYHVAKTEGIRLEGLYWLSTCLIFSIFSGLLFYEKRNKGVSTLYLLSFVFFGLNFIFSLFDFVMLDKLRMSKVYYSLITVAILTLITFVYKWIKHYYKSLRKAK